MSNNAILDRLKMLLKDDTLVAAYVEKYGEVINITNIKAIKEANKPDDLAAELNSLNIKPSTQDSVEVGDDPIYESKLICPVCHDRNVISYNLRAKSQFVEESVFLVPIYSGVGKYRKDHFTKLQTTVCPSCLFASPDPKDFSKFVEYTERTIETQLKVHSKMLMHLKDNKLDRVNRLAELNLKSPSFLRPRSVEIAIAAIHLSIYRAEVEQQFDLPNTYYKRGSYYLRIAQLQKDAGIDNTEALTNAKDMMTHAVLDSDCNLFEVELQALYLTIALNIKLGIKDELGGFIKMVKDIERMVTDELTENPTIKYKKKHATMEKWEKRSKTAMEYREDESYWKFV